MARGGSGHQTVLVFGGGNALGAYLGGVYERLHENHIRPDWIVGASVGAVTGAILAGNSPEQRLDKLRTFWAEVTQHTLSSGSSSGPFREAYNGAHTILALLLGRPSVFQGRFPGLWSIFPWMPNDIAVYDHTPLKATLERLVDFERLNTAETRLSVVCVDLETGDEVVFDNTREEIKPEHIVASTAITPIFPPVEIDDRLLCDPGYANNLPIDIAFEEPPHSDMICIAVELFSLLGSRPASLDATLERAQDILFASAGRRTVKGLRREYELRQVLEPDGPTIKLLHLAYQAASHELASKTLDFSPSSVADRWAAGRRDMEEGLLRLQTQGKQETGFEYLPLRVAGARRN
jgi:NTE family protein